MLLATVVLMAAGPLGLEFTALSSPATAVSILAVLLLALWTGFRAALLLSLGIGLSGLVWLGAGWRPGATAVFLMVVAYVGTARLVALEDEKRDVEALVRRRQAKARKIEDVVERLRMDVPEHTSYQRTRVKISARSVALLSFAKASLRPSGRSAKVSQLFDALHDLLPKGRLLLFNHRGGELTLTRAAPKALASLKGRELPLAQEPFPALLEASEPLRFPAGVQVVDGIRCTVGVALPMGDDEWSVLLLDFGDELDDDEQGAVLDIMRTAFAALTLTVGMTARWKRSSDGEEGRPHAD